MPGSQVSFFSVISERSLLHQQDTEVGKFYKKESHLHGVRVGLATLSGDGRAEQAPS